MNRKRGRPLSPIEKIYKLADYKINCNYLNKENTVKKIINLYEK